MSRKSVFNKKSILPDIKFNSILVSKFINLVMISGKKTLAESIVYYALDVLSNNTNKSHLESLENVLNNVRPVIEVKSRKIGGSIYQIPIEVKLDRGNTLAIRWIISFAKKRNEKFNIKIKLSNELLDALNNKGLSIKKRNEIYKIANANKAFAHYRW
ncbi:30S ribosomal protein S7 [endosymbiont of Pachyrhynchus infernalis]|uniref:30S ribosomal protein S7 n=1 Tax=endosymbiont of Pachyrhynchus infernalis TaxID=1971488 RepID=UPI000DC734D3|nr:30S ribosomal protein S7 [endosymbiont of Pachyrhynchus infernalis]BBA84829.1 30S ribosomal protein S7 [endosymbiont of Pachyrhynchus infernalis]